MLLATVLMKRSYGAIAVLRRGSMCLCYSRKLIATSTRVRLPVVPEILSASEYHLALSLWPPVFAAHFEVSVRTGLVAECFTVISRKSVLAHQTTIHGDFRSPVIMFLAVLSVCATTLFQP